MEQSAKITVFINDLNEELKLHLDQFISINNSVEQSLVNYLTENDFKQLKKINSDIEGARSLFKSLKTLAFFPLSCTKICNCSPHKIKNIRHHFYSNRNSLIKLRSLQAVKHAKLIQLTPDFYPVRNVHEIVARFSITWNNKVKIKLFKKSIVFSVDASTLNFIKSLKHKLCVINNLNYHYSVSFN